MGMMQKAANCFCCLVVLLEALLCSTLAAGASADDCLRECGKIKIPYPFGLRGDPTSCYRDGDFLLTCDDFYSPRKLFQGDTEVISISLLPAAKISILLRPSGECYNDTEIRTWNKILPDAYTFSVTDNVFTSVGCDTVALIKDSSDRGFVGGCASVCNNFSTIADGECSGIGCCQTAVSKGLHRNVSISAIHNDSRVIDFNPCSYSFLAEKGNYSFNSIDLAYMDPARSFPVVLDWTIGNLSCRDAVKNETLYACISPNSVCIDTSSIYGGYNCKCSQGYEGNPYVAGGCQDINECQDPRTYPCYGTCTNLPGNYSCTCPAGTTGDIISGCRPSRSHAITIAGSEDGEE